MSPPPGHRPAATAPPAPAPVLPSTGDVVMVVAAGGGVGRSTTADLLARALCPAGPLLLIDESPGLFSSRRALPRDDNGLAALDGPEGSTYYVLAPQTPAVRIDGVAAVASSGGWETLIVDTWDPALYLLHTPRWHRLLTEYGVRVVLVTASATGPLEHAVTAARALRQAGVHAQDLVAAVVDTGEGRAPRRSLARITLLDGECSGVVRIPHLPTVRATGRLADGHSGRAAERAAHTIANRLALKEVA